MLSLALTAVHGPLQVIELVQREGVQPLGTFKVRVSMHVLHSSQACRQLFGRWALHYLGAAS